MGKPPRIQLEPKQGVFLGIDVGSKKWGLAISDSLKQVAFPFGILMVNKQLFSELNLVIQDRKVEKCILGIPYHIQGGEGEKAEEIRALGDKISEQFHVSVDYVDERLTTAEAQDKLSEHTDLPIKNDDHVAAQILLQRYLDR